MQTTVNVSGMTCNHCVQAVKSEIGALPGVSEVSVALNPGQVSEVTVVSAESLTPSAIAAAVDEAGYEVV